MAYNYPIGQQIPQQGQGMTMQMQGPQYNWQNDQHYAQYQNYNQTSQHYGNYVGQLQQSFGISPWSAFQMQSEQELQSVFMHYMTPGLNGVQAEELQKVMNETQTIRNYFHLNWSLEMCKIMIAMLDRSKDGIMQYSEFKELLQCLTQWYQYFAQCDHDRSNFIEAEEVHLVIKQKLRYQISQNTLTTILKRYSKAMPNGKCLIAFDDFVSLCVRLRAYTEAFRARDRQDHQGHETGSTTMQYDDFLQVVLCL